MKGKFLRGYLIEVLNMVMLALVASCSLLFGCRRCHLQFLGGCNFFEEGADVLGNLSLQGRLNDRFFFDNGWCCLMLNFLGVNVCRPTIFETPSTIWTLRELIVFKLNGLKFLQKFHVLSVFRLVLL